MENTLLAVRLERPLTDEEDGRLLALLPEERRDRLKRILRPEKRWQVLCAYGLLGLALWERFGWRALPGVALEPQGKPYFPAYPSVRFSLSHTDGAALAGVSGSPIGVDIERLRPVPARLQERIAPGKTGERFFQEWVRREALAKWTGRGIGDLMETEPSGAGAFCPLRTFPGYVAGVAGVEAAPERVRLCTVGELAEFCRRAAGNLERNSR